MTLSDFRVCYTSCSVKRAMWSSIANLKENLNKIALDVHDDDDEEEDLTTYGSNNGGLDSDRRNSNGFRYSRSVSRSPMANGFESAEVLFLFLSFWNHFVAQFTN